MRIRQPNWIWVDGWVLQRVLCHLVLIFVHFTEKEQSSVGVLCKIPNVTFQKTKKFWILNHCLLVDMVCGPIVRKSMKEAKNRAYDIIIINRPFFGHVWVHRHSHKQILYPTRREWTFSGSYVIFTKQYDQKFIIQPCGLKNTLPILLAKRIKE